MKIRNFIIISLLFVGIVLFGVVQFVIIPHNNAEREKYILQQQEPTTHDLKSILKYKNRYMGNASNIINLFHNLPLSKVGMKFQLFPEKLTLEVSYQDTVLNIGEEKVEVSLIYNSVAAFALVDNLEAIDYNFPDESYKVKREDVEKAYSYFNDILKENIWENTVQGRLKDKKQVDDLVDKVLIKQK